MYISMKMKNNKKFGLKKESLATLQKEKSYS